MSLEVTSLILIGTLFVLLALGVEIAVSIGVTASIGLFFFAGQTIDQFAFSAFEIMNSFVLTAMPLFIFMGAIFGTTGVISRLFEAVNKLIYALPGGIACSVIFANAIFGAISGSSVAATAAFGKIAYPSMEKLGYSPSLSLGTIAVGGTLSVLIPPSVILIVYGGWQEVSVARLFAAGILPGLLLSALLVLTVIVLVKVNPRLAPQTFHFSGKEKLMAVVDMLPFILVIGLVLGMIFGGVMTPTESGAVGAFLSILMALAYRRLTFVHLKQSMWSAVSVTAMVAILMVTARVLGQVFQYIGLTDTFAQFMGQLPLGKYGIFFVICVMYIILGCFFDSFSMMVLTLPFVIPLIHSLGFNFIWFGIVYVILAEIGLVTPPFGLNLFVLHGAVPQHSVMRIAWSALPFVPAMLGTIVILTAFPDIVLWLPEVLYAR